MRSLETTEVSVEEGLIVTLFFLFFFLLFVMFCVLCLFLLVYSVYPHRCAVVWLVDWPGSSLVRRLRYWLTYISFVSGK